MYHDWKIALTPIDHDRLGAPAKYLHRIRKNEFLRDLGKSIVIPTYDEDADTGFMQPPDLGRQEAGRLHGGLFTIIKVAC